jgi:hypothetical protein
MKKAVDAERMRRRVLKRSLMATFLFRFIPKIRKKSIRMDLISFFFQFKVSIMFRDARISISVIVNYRGIICDRDWFPRGPGAEGGIQAAQIL